MGRSDRNWKRKVSGALSKRWKLPERGALRRAPPSVPAIVGRDACVPQNWPLCVFAAGEIPGGRRCAAGTNPFLHRFDYCKGVKLRSFDVPKEHLKIARRFNAGGNAPKPQVPLAAP